MDRPVQYQRIIDEDRMSDNDLTALLAMLDHGNVAPIDHGLQRLVRSMAELRRKEQPGAY